MSTFTVISPKNISIVQRIFFYSGFFVLLFIFSCSKQSDPPTLDFNSLSAGGVGLSLVSPTNVPSNAKIVASLTSNIDPGSVNSNTIKLFRLFDSTYVDMNYAVLGNTITIIPNADLGSGVSYQLTFMNIQSTDGLVMTYLWRAFTTAGSFGPPGQVAYWNFNGNIYDQLGNYNSVTMTDVNYAISFRRSLGQCVAFNGTSAIIQVPNGDQLLNTNDFSISFWVKANPFYQLDSAGKPKGQLVLGLGDYKGFEFSISEDYSYCQMVASYALPDGTAVTEPLYFAGDGKTQSNGGEPGWISCVDLTSAGGLEALVENQWAFICFSYSSASKLGTLYINGLMMKQQDFNQWPVGDPARTITGMKYAGTLPLQEPVFAMGFMHSANSQAYSGTSWGNYNSPFANHFRGWLDELRIFHSALDSEDVDAMYQQTKP